MSFRSAAGAEEHAFRLRYLNSRRRQYPSREAAREPWPDPSPEGAKETSHQSQPASLGTLPPTPAYL